MLRFLSRLWLITIFLLISNGYAQRGESPIKIFGYFQTSFQHWTEHEDNLSSGYNSFSVQQLNLFFQKDLSRNWSAFVNFEFLNNFSSSRQWGSANLEEAWVKYRMNEKLNLKLGLQIPIFNNLNTIKNRTPLLPYIIRPIAYETSFNEFFPVDEFVPARAFAQAYGFFPAGKWKLEYAAHVGNSPNINNDREKGQTGVDTTSTFSVGGRVGIRYQELKLGISATHEKLNNFRQLAPELGRDVSELTEVPLLRLGGDLSFNFAKFSLESEFIISDVKDDVPELDLELQFYYATLGYFFTEKLFLYGSYWVVKSRAELLYLQTGFINQEGFIDKEKTTVPNIGISYNLSDRIRIKGQAAHVIDEDFERNISGDIIFDNTHKFNVYALAVSVFF